MSNKDKVKSSSHQNQIFHFFKCVGKDKNFVIDGYPHVPRTRINKNQSLISFQFLIPGHGLVVGGAKSCYLVTKLSISQLPTNLSISRLIMALI